MVLTSCIPSPTQRVDGSARKSYFGKGRQVTITGHIQNVSEVYTDKAGAVRLRKNPEVHLTDHSPRWWSWPHA